MKLTKLLKGIAIPEIKGPKEIEITGICSNSKLVVPGNLFVARRGRVDDGVSYIPEAIACGATAVLTEMYDPTLKSITQIITRQVVAVEAKLAAHFYQFPSDELFMVGITGTKGKTTAAFIIKHLLDKIHGICGLIGTIEYILGKHRRPATLTTPDVVANHKMLREMVQQGCRSAVMEVTSHALTQGRVDGIHYDVAIFSNLTLDHLDYHGTMEEYCQAKNLLFRNLGKEKRTKKGPVQAIVNADSPWTEKITAGCQAPILTYGIDNKAELMASDIQFGRHGTTAAITYQGRTLPFRWPLIGRFNVYNCLAAIGVALTRGKSLEETAELMAAFPAVPGRLEKVDNDLGLEIYVDFAHTDDALKNVLQCLTELKKGRIITVFGCGGDRDTSKRPKMAEASERYSDITIVTSDNPRTEDPQAICQAIVKGFRHRDSYIVEVDRRRAIQKAIEIANKNDIILIAGKGHEPYQLFAHQTIEFDDRKVAAALCAKPA